MAYQLTSAESIRKKTVNNPEIKEHVKNILKDIDEKIAEVSSRDSKIKFKLPRDIFVQGLSVKDTQRIIYYKVVKEIVDKGFDLTIDTKNNEFIVNIQWVTDMEKSSAQEIDKFIAQYTREYREAEEKNGAKKKAPIKHVNNIFDEDKPEKNESLDFFNDEPI